MWKEIFSLFLKVSFRISFKILLYIQCMAVFIVAVGINNFFPFYERPRLTSSHFVLVFREGGEARKNLGHSFAVDPRVEIKRVFKRRRAVCIQRDASGKRKEVRARWERE